MDTTNNREVIEALTKLTTAGKLGWRLSDPPSTLTDGSEAVVPLFFVSAFRERIFGLYEIRRQDYDGQRDKFYWFTSVGLALFVGPLGPAGSIPLASETPLLEIYQPQRDLSALLEAVRAQTAKLSELLNDLKAELPDDDDLPF